MKNFEEYLKTMHAEQYTGTDDNMPDDFNNRLEQFDVNDILQMVKDYEWNYSHVAGKYDPEGINVGHELAGGLTDPSY